MNIPPALIALLQAQDQFPPARVNPSRVMDTPVRDVPAMATPSPMSVPQRPQVDWQSRYSQLTGSPKTSPRTAMPGYNDPLPPPDRLGPARETRDAEFQKLMSLMQRPMPQAQVPQMQQPVGYRELLPVGALALIAHLLGAGESDIAQGLGGFMQGRQNWAQGVNQQRGQQFDYDQRFQELTRQNEVTGAKMGYEKAADDFGFEQQQRNAELSRERSLADRDSDREWWKEQEATRQAGRVDLNRAKAITDGLKSANPEIRMKAAALYFQGDADAIQAFGTLSPAEQLKIKQGDYTDVRKAGAELDNEFKRQSFEQRLENLRLEGKIKDETWQFIKIKREKYPAYLQALMNRGLLQDQRTIQAMQGSFNDATADAFDRKHGAYLKSQYKRLEEAQAAVDDLTDRHKAGLTMLQTLRSQGGDPNEIKMLEEGLPVLQQRMLDAKNRLNAIKADIDRVEATAPEIKPFNPLLPQVNGGTQVNMPGSSAPAGKSEIQGNSFNPNNPPPTTPTGKSAPVAGANTHGKTGGKKQPKPTPPKNKGIKLLGVREQKS